MSKMNKNTNEILALQIKIVNEIFKARTAMEDVERMLVAIGLFLEDSNRLQEKIENNNLHNNVDVN